MKWTAIVPFKTDGDAKSRLSSRLTLAERRELANAMLAHLAQALSGCEKIERMVMVSEERPADWDGDWIRDPGRGLNAAITAAADKSGRPVLVIHGDLPLIESADVSQLLEAAEAKGLAIAPDRHGTGTNALAIADGRPFTFQFGEGSFARHLAEAGDVPPAVVTRVGLQVDCDTPDDLELVNKALPKPID